MNIKKILKRILIAVLITLLSTPIYPMFPAQAETIESMTRDTFEQRFVITRGTPDHSSVEWADEDYTRWYVAYKDANDPNNVYFDRKLIDISEVSNTQDFLNLNDHYSRNRFFYDSEYDDAAYNAQDTEFCLRAELDKINQFRSTGETGEHEWFIKHWAFIAPKGAGKQGNVFNLGENPSESSTFKSPHNPGTSSEKTLSLNYKYDWAVGTGLCVHPGERTGVVAQVIENDKGDLNDDTQKIERMIAAFAKGAENAEDPVSEAVFFFVEFASYVKLLVANARKDDRLYPVSLSFTWGALKRMQEKGVNVGSSNSKYIKPYGVPESPDAIQVTDMWREEDECNHGSYSPPGSSETIRYNQYCLADRPANERSYPYDEGVHREFFYLPSNQEDRSVEMYFTLSALAKQPDDGCSINTGGTTWICPTGEEVNYFTASQESCYAREGFLPSRQHWGALLNQYDLQERGWPSGEYWIRGGAYPFNYTIDIESGSVSTVAQNSYSVTRKYTCIVPNE